jgi:YVTN family beta-propeller protein
MSRLRRRLLFAAGASTALLASPVIIDRTAATSTTEVDSGAVEPTATITLAQHVDGGVVTDDAVWAIVTEDETLYRIDPDTNTVVQELSTPGIGIRFDIGHGAAWFTDFDGNVVRRVDLESGTVTAEIPTGESPEGISVTDTAVWVANHHDGTVARIDPTTNAVVATIEVGPAGPGGPQPILASEELVWVGVFNLGQVVVIDATTNAVVDKIDSTATCGEIELLDGSLWVTNCFESDDVAVIAEDGTARGLHAGGPAGTPLQIDGDVWLPTISLDGPPGHLLRVDPVTLEILDSVATDPQAYAIGQGFDSLWSFSWDAGAVIRHPIDNLVHPAG